MTESHSLFKSIFLLLALVTFSSPLPAETLTLPTPTASDTCPVCGMFVAKYPEWVATVLYKDGHTHHFDGAKDLFKYLLDMKKWAGEDRAEDIQHIGVTEYYELTMIDAKNAFYVVGSDVLGPMGHELIPLASEEDAKEFLNDHKGKRSIQFPHIGLSLLKNLDNAEFTD